MFTHEIFANPPTDPVAFLIYERKYQCVHEWFLQKFIEKVPNLKKKSVKFITDREYSITNAVTNVLPNARILHCWNHIRKDVKMWLHKKNASTDDVTVYTNDVLDLLKSDDRKSFDLRYENLSQKWSQAFCTYFDFELKNELLKYSVKWDLEECGMYDPYSGITNNRSESFNKVLKEMVNWKKYL